MRFLGIKGSVAMAAVIALPAMFGAAAISVDVGHAYMVWNQLQASTQAAALAAAKDIGNGGTPLVTAQTYGAANGGWNQLSGVTVTTSPTLYCLNAALACTTIQTPPTSANAIEVTQTASVPTYFARILGISSISMSSSALALAAGRSPPPLNVAFIIDATASMGDTDPSCGKSRIGCAISGFETMLSELWPCKYGISCTGSNPVDQAALFQFPPLSAQPTSGSCSRLTTVAYNAKTPVYEVVPLSANYRTSDTATTLNSSSTLVKCLTSMSAPGGFGTFYAAAINAAQASFPSCTASTSTVCPQNVIILESDGEANAKANIVPVGDVINQCQQAVKAANAATSAGTWVYTISYGSSNTIKPAGCTTDSTGLLSGVLSLITSLLTPSYANSCFVLSQIASDPTKFYADNGNGCKSPSHPSITALTQMFQNIAYSLTLPRLLPLACLKAGSASCSLLASG